MKEHLTFTGEASPLANQMLSVRGAFAEFERARIGDQREGISLAKARGAYRGALIPRQPVQTTSNLLWFVSRNDLLQLPENDPGKVPFQDALDFPITKSFGCAPRHVFFGCFVESHAGFDDHVQSHVQMTVSVAVEPVSGGVSRGGLQGATPAREANAASFLNLP